MQATKTEKYGYELFYSCGGHGGPYWTFQDAINAAKGRLEGCKTMHFIDIVVRDPITVGGYGMRVERVLQRDIDA